MDNLNGNMHIHNFISTVVPSTCKEHGYTLHKCECGCEHKENFLPLINHNFQVVARKNPTCTENGEQTLVCTFCGETQHTIIPSNGHSFCDWKIQSFPTCTVEGEKVRYCNHCGYSETQSTPILGHKLTNYQKSQNQKGMIDCFCQNCGQTITIAKSRMRKKSFFSKHKKLVALLVCLAIIISVVAVLTPTLFLPLYHYNTAKKLIDSGDYTEAYQHLKDCDGFKDSKELLENFTLFHKKVIETNYNKEGDHKTVEYDYDKNGNMILVTWYDENGEIANKYEYEYDKNGNMILATWYDENGEIADKYEYEYDKNGNMILESRYEYGNLDYKCEYEYDKNDNMILVMEYNKDGNLEYKSEYEYDKNGNMILETCYNESGDLYLKIEYDYDKNDNKILETWYGENGEIINKYEYEYNKNGNMILEMEYNEDGNLEYKCEYEYDKNGNLTLETCYDDGEIAYKYEYEYKEPFYVYQMVKKN